MEMNLLETEIHVYQENLPKFRDQHPMGGFVVIKGEEILGIWNDRMDAIRAALKQYGNVSFLVKSIAPRTFPNSTTLTKKLAPIGW
jgi:predicted naringenin-chalcone synthase